MLGRAAEPEPQAPAPSLRAIAPPRTPVRHAPEQAHTWDLGLGLGRVQPRSLGPRWRGADEVFAMKHSTLILGAALAAALLSGCSSTGLTTVKDWFGTGDSQSPKFVTAPDVTITAAPFETVHVQWKQALDTPYVYMSLQGDYRDAVRYVGSLMQHLESQGIRPTGPPFALYFDDPLAVPTEDCRFQVAVPVDGMTSATAPLGFSVLPTRNLIYSRIRGCYPDTDQAYPQMFEYLRDRSWVLDGPIRQILLVDPASVATFNELISEVQMPFRPL